MDVTVESDKIVRKSRRRVVRTRRRGRIRHVQEYLSPDICREILCRLPVKELLKFRLVCRTWRSIIDDPQFVSFHLTRYKNNVERSRLFIVEECRQIYHVIRHSDTYRKIGVPDLSPLEVFRPYGNIHIVGCINGLFVLWVLCKYTTMVWNPSIRRHFILPPFPRTVNYVSLGFGFDPSTNNYKVVSVCQQGSSWDSLETVVYLYTFGSGSWRVISCDDHFPLFSQRKVFINGSIYWATKGDLVSFDVAGEFFSRYNLPYDGSCYKTFPVNLGESLALLNRFFNYCCLWVRDEYDNGKNWIKLHTINEVKWCSSMYLKMNGEILFTDKSMCSYDINTHETKVLGKSYRARVMWADVYVESLVWPRGAV